MTGWYALMVERPASEGRRSRPNTRTRRSPGSCTGCSRTARRTSSTSKTPEGDIPRPAEYHNLADIGRPAAWVVVKVLTAAFALAVVLLCRWPARGERFREGWRFAAECGLIVPRMLLFSERTWKHHAVMLLTPGRRARLRRDARLSAARPSLWLGSLVASTLLMAVPELFGTPRADLALVYGTHTVAFLLLTAGICLICLRNRGGIVELASHSA